MSFYEVYLIVNYLSIAKVNDDLEKISKHYTNTIRQMYIYMLYLIFEGFKLNISFSQMKNNSIYGVCSFLIKIEKP